MKDLRAFRNLADSDELPRHAMTTRPATREPRRTATDLRREAEHALKELERREHDRRTSYRRQATRGAGAC